MTTAATPEDQPIVLTCSSFWTMSDAGRSTSSWSTRSIGLLDRWPTSQKLVELFDAHAVSFVSDRDIRHYWQLHPLGMFETAWRVSHRHLFGLRATFAKELLTLRDQTHHIRRTCTTAKKQRSEEVHNFTPCRVAQE